MRAQAAGEQAVPVGDVDPLARSPAGGADRPGHQPRPGTDVRAGVPDDRRPAGGTRRGVQPDDLVAGDGEHPERVVLAQVRLGGEREARQVGQGTEVVGMYAGPLVRRPVVRDPLVRVPDRPAQPLQLQRAQFLDRCPFDRLQVLGSGTRVAHSISMLPSAPVCTNGPPDIR